MSTGMLIFLLLASAVLTAPVSLLLLWRYRGAVIRAMAGRSGVDASASSAPAAPGAGPTADLSVETLSAATLGALDSPSYRSIRHSLGVAIGINVAAGLAYAAVMT